MASSASLTLRKIERSAFVKTTFTYCWVMVEPPWTTFWWMRSCQAARMIPDTLIPPWW